jgi:hypothetical protein
VFIQVIVGKVKDAARAIADGERWSAEVKPGAIGFLGGTSGVTDDGTSVVVARFESAETAKANSQRPEQDAHWQSTKDNYVGDPTVYDCPDVDLMLGGGSDDAGFVQVMIYKPKDVAAIKAMSGEFEKLAPMRPDIMGASTGYATDGTVIDTTYFTTEAAAREGEKKDMPAEMQSLMQSLGENAGEITFLDLKAPRFL